MATTRIKMKKLLLSAILFLGLNVLASAQQEKTGVGIMSFTYVSSSASFQDVNSIQETVINAFVKTKRFNIVDRSKMDALQKEKDLQKSEDFIDGSVIQQGVSLGANFLISGHVISAQAERMETAPDETTGRVTVTYKARLSITLKVIDVSTGQVIVSETIEPQGGSALGGMMGLAPSTPEAAITKAIKDIEGKVDAFVSKNFPATFSIVEIQEKDKKGGASVLMISGGASFNLQKGDRLKVVEISMIDVNGKQMERKKDIGELKITKVEDDNFSTCNVTSGGIDINSKFESKAKIVAITKF